MLHNQNEKLTTHMPPSLFMLIVGVLVALITSAIATEVTIRFSNAHKLLDRPNDRSSHTVPTPRLGGIGIAVGLWAGVAASSAINLSASSLPLLITATMFAIVGFVDDVLSLKPLLKYAGQLVATVFFVVLSTRNSGQLPWIGITLILFWVTGFTNAFNFMDGINGLCGGTGILYSVFLALIAVRLHDTTVTTMSFLLAAACTGFLLFNFPHARSFMGDTGSMLIGSGLAVLSVRLIGAGGPRVAFSVLLVLSAFLFDTSFTIIRRIRCGENILQAHRTHLYQRLVRGGKSHVEVASLYFAYHLALGALGVLSVGRSNQLLISSAFIAASLLVALILYVHRLENHVQTVPDLHTSIVTPAFPLAATKVERTTADRSSPRSW